MLLLYGISIKLSSLDLWFLFLQSFLEVAGPLFISILRRNDIAPVQHLVMPRQEYSR